MTDPDSGQVECAGDPRAMGRAQGVACRDAIRARLSRAGVHQRGRARASLRPFLAGPVLADGMAREIVRHFPHLSERFQGIARGAGVSVDAVLDLFVRGASGALSDEALVQGALLGARRGVGALLARGVVPDAGWIARRSRPEVGFRSLELTLPWTATAVAGVNVAGVAVAIAPAPRPGRAPACTLLVQECLQRFEDVTGCLDWCLKRPVSGDATIVIADASGALSAVRIEGESRRILQAGEDGVFVAADGSPERDALRAGLAAGDSPEALLGLLGGGIVVSPTDRSLRMRAVRGSSRGTDETDEVVRLVD